MDFITAGKRKIGKGQPVYFIAEIGSNFDGSIEQAKKLIDLAKEAGADAAKFQHFLTEKILCKEAFENLQTSFQEGWGKKTWDVYREAEFPREWTQELFDYCKSKGIDFLSAPYDIEAADLLDKTGVKLFKIGSGEVTNPRFLKYVAGKGKPIVLSVGATRMEEIEEAVEAMRETGNNEIALLQCVTNYPSPVEDANIRFMQVLGEKFDIPVGYSDHSLGTTVPIAAVALGASIIEKHFTRDKARAGPDHPHSLNPNEFKSMVKEVRELEKALGSGEKKIEASEQETVIIQRRSIYSAKDIKKGQTITAEMLAVLRPEKGLLPKYFDEVVGKKAKEEIKKGSPITWENIGR